MSTEATLESVYESHAAELGRLKADYTRELNAKLEQINKQAETIRDERRDHELTVRILDDRNHQLNDVTKDLERVAKNNVQLRRDLLSALATIEEARTVIELGVKIMTVEQVGKWVKESK